jgi:pimeloyl-ACP methyl ester carboxylesterase
LTLQVIAERPGEAGSFVFHAPAGQTPSGEGLPILWLHGWAHDHRDWPRLIAEFPHRRHYLADAPGHGKAPPPPEAWGPDEYAAALLAQLPPDLADGFLIVGHSFGCRVAMCAAARSDTIKGLMLIAAPGAQRKRSLGWHARSRWLKLLGNTAKLSDKLIGTKHYAKYAETFGSADYKAAGAMRPTFVRIVNVSLEPFAAQVKQPTLLVFGEKDTETPPELGERFKSLMPGAELTIIDGATHNGLLAEHALAVATRLRRFLQRTGL